MNSCTDREFDTVIYESILPNISKAFCLLEKSLTGSAFICQSKKLCDDVLDKEAQTMKSVISDYIDGQVYAMKLTVKERT